MPLTPPSPLPPSAGAAALLQVLPDPVLFLDNSGEVLFNPAAQRFLGRPRSGESWLSLFPADIAADLQAALEQVESSEGKVISRHYADEWQATLCTDAQGVWIYWRSDPARERTVQLELQRSEERYRSLTEATSQIVWRTDLQGRISSELPTWQAFTGQTPAEYWGMGWADAVHPDDRAETFRVWQEAIEHQDTYRVRHRLRRHDGIYVPMLARGVKIKASDGHPAEWVGTHSDYSLQAATENALHTLNSDLKNQMLARTQELSEVSRFMALLLTSAGEGIFGLDLQGHNMFVNPAGSQMLGYAVGEMLGQSSHELLHHSHANGEPFAIQECPIHRTLQDGRQRRVKSDIFWHKGGYAVPVSYVVTATHDDAGQVTGAVVMFQDITEQLRVRTELEDAVTLLRQTNADLEQFAYVASHDLQEPLRTLGSYAELFGRRYQDKLDDRADQYINYMLSAVTRMRSLIQDLLAFSRVGRGDMAFEDIKVESLMRQVAQNLQFTLSEGGGELTWDVPGTVYGQPSLLLQLLTNLVANALKFARPGVPAVVRVTGTPTDEGYRIEVRDNGIGIEEEYHERVFAIFQRLHLREEYAGNGIGLAIARKIVTAHGGTLTVESVPGQGSTFIITLPAGTGA